MRSTHTPIAVTLLALTAATAASAQVGVSLTNVNNSAQLTGYVTQDVKADTVNDWTSAAIVLELDAGSIYQDGFGNDAEPNPAFFSYFPSLEFDTYLAGGPMGVGILGAGGDAGGEAYQFDNLGLDASWRSNSPLDVGLTRIARVTLTDDASGTWRLAVMQADDETRHDFTGTIVNGVMAVDP